MAKENCKCVDYPVCPDHESIDQCENCGNNFYYRDLRGVLCEDCQENFWR